jgi:hypothetical protein
MQANSLPETGLVRLAQIVGNPKRGIPPLIPISKSTWWKGVREGRFPQPVKLSKKCTCWLAKDIRRLIEQS